MCQIIGLSNVKGLTRKQLNTLALTSQKLVSSQRDGFGFAYATKQRQTKKHSYYCEKYVNPTDFKSIGSVGYTKQHLGKLGNAIEMDMLSSGHADAPTGAFIAHGRIATNGKTIANTHPFRKKGYAMVHNGVVDFEGNEDDLKYLHKRYSTCDSEWLLNSYVYEAGHHTWSDYLTGYAATLTITPDNEFIVAKGERASLYAGAIPSLNNGCLVFATRKDYISQLAKSLELVATPAFELKDNWACRINEEGQVKVEKFTDMPSFNRGSLGYTQASMAFEENQPKISYKPSGKKKKNYSTTKGSTYVKTGTNSYTKAKPTDYYGMGCGIENHEVI